MGIELVFHALNFPAMQTFLAIGAWQVNSTSCMAPVICGTLLDPLIFLTPSNVDISITSCT
jgi:hypothetical protein